MSESNIIKLEFIESNQFKIENESQSNKNKDGYQLLVAHPNIYSAISSLKIEEVQNSISFYKAKKKERPPYRRQLDILADSNIHMLI